MNSPSFPAGTASKSKQRRKPGHWLWAGASAPLAVLLAFSPAAYPQTQNIATTQQQRDSDNPYAALIATVRSYAEETFNGEEHVRRWQRVLKALGEKDAAFASLTPMTASEAQTYADRGWTRWEPVVTALTALEAAVQPTVNITGGSTVTEGGDVTFTLTADPAPASDIQVGVSVTESGNVAGAGATGTRTVTVGTSGTVDFTVATEDDAIDEADGSIAATITTGTGYTVGSTATASVTVADNEVPTVNVTSAAGGAEGDEVTFVITATPAPASALPVNVAVTGAGEYGISGGARTVSIPTSGSFTLTLSTTDDEVDEEDGSVTLTLETGTGYTVGSLSSRTASITDDDLPQNICERLDALNDAGTVCDLSSKGIKSLKAGDFNGLSKVRILHLHNNALTTLPDNVFSGLSSLEQLYLGPYAYIPTGKGGSSYWRSGSHLTSISADAFSGLSKLKHLSITNNSLTSLPEDVFDGLSNLVGISLYNNILYNNSLTSLPEDVFDGLSNLKYLSLYRSQLSSLPEDVFDGLSNLEELGLAGNHLKSLPEDVFDGLSNLERLYLQENKLTSLPEDIFDGLSNLVSIMLIHNKLTCLPKGIFDGLSNLRYTYDVEDLPHCEPTVSFAGGSESVSEAVGTHNVTVGLSPAPASDISLDYTVNGTATAGTDYTALSGTVAVPAGATSVVIPVVITDDDIHESSESIVLTLTTGADYDLGATTAHTLTVTDNDQPSVSFVPINWSYGEWQGTANVEVKLDKAPAMDLTISYTVGGTATAGTDYTALSGTVTVAAGATSAVIPVVIIDDSEKEYVENIILRLADGADYDLGTETTLTLTILDNDGTTVSFTSGSETVSEAVGSHKVGLTLSPAPTWELLIYYYTVLSGTATAGTDYTALSGSVAVPAGATSVTIPVVITDDDIHESSETITLTLPGAVPYTLGATTTYTLTITDDDRAGVKIRESQGSTIVTEAAGAGRTDSYTVALSSKPSADVSIRVASAMPTAAQVHGPGGTAGGTATLHFTPGNWSTAQTVTVTGVDDDVENEEESDSEVALSHRSVRISHTAVSDDDDYDGIEVVGVVVQVVDDDATTLPVTDNEVPEVNITSVAGGTEGGDVVFTLTANPAPAASLPVSVTVTGAGDYGISTGSQTVSIPTGGSFTLTLSTTDDEVDEDDGSVTLSLETGTGYTVGPLSSQTASILDNDVTIEAQQAESSEAQQQADPYAALIARVRGYVGETFNGEEHVKRWQRVLKALGEKDTAFTALTAMTATEAQTYADRGWTRWDEVVTALTALEAAAQPPAQPPVQPPVQPTISITGGSAVTEGEDVTFTLTVNPAPAANLPVTVSVSETGSFAASGEAGTRTVTVGTGGTVDFTVSTDDDAVDEADGSIAATVTAGTGYTVGSVATASVTVNDDDVSSKPMLSVSDASGREGEALEFVVSLSRPREDGMSVLVRTRESDPVSARHGQDFRLRSDGQDYALLTFHPGDREKTVLVSTLDDVHDDDGETFELYIDRVYFADGVGIADGVGVGTIVNSDPMPAAWLGRFGRTVSQQVVDAVRGRFKAAPVVGLDLTVAGEHLSGVPLEENEGALRKLLGFESVRGEQVVADSSFSFSPPAAADAAGGDGGVVGQWSVWGQGAVSSFSGQEEELSLSGDVSTVLLGADWRAGRWQAGAALSRSWGSGGYQGEGDDGADGSIGTVMTGLFPYGRYALSPRLGVWAIGGYGWGDLTLKPERDGGEELSTTTNLVMGAVGLEGVVLDGGADGLSLTTTADALVVETVSAKTTGLKGSAATVSRLRLGLEATRPFPMDNGALLLPSLEVGLRQDSGDAETGYGVEVGAGVIWTAPQHGIRGELRGRSLVTHTEEEFRQQGLALSFAWDPSPSNRGPSLSMGHTMGAATAGGMDALLSPTVIQGLDGPASDGQHFEAQLAYGFPFHHDRLTLSPAVALALSPDSRSYAIRWSLTPYSQQGGQSESWEVTLEAQRQEHSSSPAQHSLKLDLSLTF